MINQMNIGQNLKLKQPPQANYKLIAMKRNNGCGTPKIKQRQQSKFPNSKRASSKVLEFSSVTTDIKHEANESIGLLEDSQVLMQRTRHNRAELLFENVESLAILPRNNQFIEGYERIRKEANSTTNKTNVAHHPLITEHSVTTESILPFFSKDAINLANINKEASLVTEEDDPQQFDKIIGKLNALKE